MMDHFHADTAQAANARFDIAALDEAMAAPAATSVISSDLSETSDAATAAARNLSLNELLAGISPQMGDRLNVVAPQVMQELHAAYPEKCAPNSMSCVSSPAVPVQYARPHAQAPAHTPMPLAQSMPQVPSMMQYAPLSPQQINPSVLTNATPPPSAHTLAQMQASAHVSAQAQVQSRNHVIVTAQAHARAQAQVQRQAQVRARDVQAQLEVAQAAFAQAQAAPVHPMAPSPTQSQISKVSMGQQKAMYWNAQNSAAMSSHYNVQPQPTVAPVGAIPGKQPQYPPSVASMNARMQHPIYQQPIAHMAPVPPKQEAMPATVAPLEQMPHAMVQPAINRVTAAPMPAKHSPRQVAVTPLDALMAQRAVTPQVIMPHNAAAAGAPMPLVAPTLVRPNQAVYAMQPTSAAAMRAVPVAPGAAYAQEDKERKMVRAERNRHSAAASRERKKQHLNELERRVSELSKRNAQLQIEQIRAVCAHIAAERLRKEIVAIEKEQVEVDMLTNRLKHDLALWGQGDTAYYRERSRVLRRSKSWDCATHIFNETPFEDPRRA